MDASQPQPPSRGGRRPGAGRPRHPEDQRLRNRRLTIGLTTQQSDYVAQVAVDRSLKPAEAVRALIEAARTGPDVPTVLQRVLRGLQRAGVAIEADVWEAIRVRCAKP